MKIYQINYVAGEERATVHVAADSLINAVARLKQHLGVDELDVTGAIEALSKVILPEVKA